MKIATQQFELHRRQQRKQRPLLTLLTPVYTIVLLCIALLCASARADCYVDPFTGRQICTTPESGWQPFSGAGTPRLAEPQPTVESNAHCRISVADGSTGSGTLIAVDKSVGLVLTCSHLFDSSM